MIISVVVVVVVVVVVAVVVVVDHLSLTPDTNDDMGIIFLGV